MRKIILLLLIIYCSDVYSQITVARNELHWSPDGKKILLLLEVKPIAEKKSAHSIYDHDEIFIMDANGNNLTRLTYVGTDVADPGFSPDSKQVVFTSYVTGISQIYIMNADGTFQKNISNTTTNEFNPVWSPKGDKIAYESTKDKTAQIYIMNSDGSDVERVGNLEYNNSDPLWSPDGTKIICSSTKMPGVFKNSLIDLNSDSSTIININYDFKKSYQFDEFTKDGEKVLYHESFQNFFVNNNSGSLPTQNIYLYDVVSNLSTLIQKNLYNINVLGFATNSDSIIIFENSNLYVIDVNKNKKNKIFSDVNYADFSFVNNLIALISNQYVYTIKLDGSGKINLTKK